MQSSSCRGQPLLGGVVWSNIAHRASRQSKVSWIIRYKHVDHSQIRDPNSYFKINKNHINLDTLRYTGLQPT